MLRSKYQSECMLEGAAGGRGAPSRWYWRITLTSFREPISMNEASDVREHSLVNNCR